MSTQPSQIQASKSVESYQTPLLQTSKTKTDFRVLLVDDDPINLQVLYNHLSPHYAITQASSGLQALQLIEDGLKPSLILLDVMMPKMSGYEVCQAIRQRYLPNELPVVMLTAKNQISDLVMGFSNGANDYLPKPFSKDELLARVQTHLELANINQSYSRFVPHEYFDFLHKESIIKVTLGDHVAKEMTVMFSDIRSFTSISETMTSQENFNFVNAYFKRVSPKIRDNHGFVVKYLGDGMMAIFPNRADDAVKAGIEKLQAVQQYNQQRIADGWQPIQIGVGVHVGPMMMGMVGDANRMQGDAFSDDVNLAARVESLTKRYGLSFLITDDVLTHLSNPDQYPLRFLDRVIVKGRQKPVTLHEVFGHEEPALITLKLKTQAQFSKAISYYQQGKLDEAQTCFEAVLAQNPHDKAVPLYLNRLQTLRQQGLPSNWDGVCSLAEK